MDLDQGQRRFHCQGSTIKIWVGCCLRKKADCFSFFIVHQFLCSDPCMLLSNVQLVLLWNYFLKYHFQKLLLLARHRLKHHLERKPLSSFFRLTKILATIPCTSYLHTKKYTVPVRIYAQLPDLIDQKERYRTGRRSRDGSNWSIIMSYTHNTVHDWSRKIWRHLHVVLNRYLFSVPRST